MGAEGFGLQPSFYYRLLTTMRKVVAECLR